MRIATPVCAPVRNDKPIVCTVSMSGEKSKVSLLKSLDLSGLVEQHSEGGVKYDFEGERYIVRCDKAAGYLRIYDKRVKSYCLLDGTPCDFNELTHFKIKRREEM